MPKSFGLSIVIGSAVAGAVNGFKSVLAQTDKLGSAIDDLRSKRIEIIENDAKVLRYKERLSTLSQTIDRLYAKRRELQLKRDLAKSDEEAEKFAAELKDVNKKLRLLNGRKLKIKDELNEARAEAKRTNREFLRLGDSIEKLNRYGAKLSELEAKRERFRARLFDTVAIGATVAFPVKKAIEFESAMADVAKVANLNRNEVYSFGNALTGLSTKIPIAAEGLAQIAASGAQLGIAKDKLVSFTEIVAKMSTAFDMSADAAGENIAKLMNVYGIGLKEVNRLGDALNYLSDNTAAKAADMVEVLSRVGGTAKMFGLAAKDTAALADAFLAMGKAPEVAATAINALLVKLSTADKQGEKFKKGLKRLGFDEVSIKSTIENDPQKAIMDVLKGIKALDKEAQMGVLYDMFGAEYADDIALIVSGLENYKKALSLVRDEQNYLNSMQKEFENRSATTKNKLQLLGNSLSRIGISLGSILLPPLTAIADGLASFFDSVSALNEKFPLLGKAVAFTAVGLGSLAVASAVIGYGFSFVLTGITKLKIGLIGLTGAARVFTAVLAANPIGLAATAIVALGAAAVWAYNKFEWFRDGVSLAWEGIKKIFSFSPIGLVVKAWQPVFDWLGGKFEWLGKAVEGIKAFGSSIADFFGFGGEEKRVELKKSMRHVVAGGAAAAAIALPTAAAAGVQKETHRTQNYTININVSGTDAKPEEIARAVQKALQKTRDRKFEDDE